MAKQPIQVNLVESSQLRALTVRLKRADMAKDLRREIALATADAVPKVRSEIMSAPSQTEGTSKLRRAIAMAVKRRIVLGARRAFVAIEWRPRGGLSNLGRAFEGEIEWRHPTFGHDPESPQEGKAFFWATLAKVSAETAARVQLVISNFERKIMR